jgi:hypothetical protein
MSRTDTLRPRLTDAASTPPITPITPAAPEATRPPRKPWHKRTWVRVTGALVAAPFAIGIIAAAAGSHPATTASPSPSPSRSAPAAAPSSPAPFNPVTATPQQIIAHWFANGGSAQLKAVSGDLGTTQSDSDAAASALESGGTATSQIATLAADGTQLQKDAQAALTGAEQNGITGNASLANLSNDYTTALADLASAGGTLAQLPQVGNMLAQMEVVQTANSLITTANTDLSAATQYVQSLNS